MDIWTLIAWLCVGVLVLSVWMCYTSKEPKSAFDKFEFDLKIDKRKGGKDMLVGIMIMAFMALSFVGFVFKQKSFPVAIVVVIGVICAGILIKRKEKGWVVIGTLLILTIGLSSIGVLGLLDLDYIFREWIFPTVFAVLFTFGLVLVLLERKKKGEKEEPK